MGSCGLYAFSVQLYLTDLHLSTDDMEYWDLIGGRLEYLKLDWSSLMEYLGFEMYNIWSIV